MRGVVHPGRGVGLLLVAAVAATVLEPWAARADSEELERALRLYEEGDLASALAAFERAQWNGGNDAPSMVVIYLHLGVLRAGAGDTEGATAAFRALLQIDPEAAPPRDASPVVLAPFEDARAAGAGAPAFRARVEEAERRNVGERHVAFVHVEGDSEGLVRSVRAEVVGGSGAGAIVEATGRSPYRLLFPSETTREARELRYRLDLLDGRGSTLRSQGPRSVAVFATSEPSGGSVLGSPLFWGAVTVLVGGAVLAIAIASADSGEATVGAPVFE